MALAKTELFSKDLAASAALFKAISHPARLQILQFLSESENCITGDISQEIPLGRTTVNQHLKELKSIGLITGHIEGVKTKYCLNKEKITELQSITLRFIGNLKINNFNCK